MIASMGTPELRFYLPVEMMKGRWYYLVESNCLDERAKPYGPFASERAARTHQQQNTMIGDQDRFFWEQSQSWVQSLVNSVTSHTSEPVELTLNSKRDSKRKPQFAVLLRDAVLQSR